MLRLLNVLSVSEKDATLSSNNHTQSHFEILILLTSYEYAKKTKQTKTSPGKRKNKMSNLQLKELIILE